MILSPSILNIEKDNLESSLQEMQNVGINVLHLDIMDGKFVENNTRKADLQKDINHFDFVFDTHLMVEDPLFYVDSFIDNGSHMITFHYEAVMPKEIPNIIKYIKSKNVLCGISIKPNTDVRVLEPYLKYLDLILIMSVEPGKGGQKFMPQAVDKVSYLNYLKENDPSYSFIISVDGGINEEIAEVLSKAGANMVVMGTAFIKHENKKQLVDKVAAL